ncbi:phage tail protein [Streptomyces sp. NPDC048644]|uniref:phage tail protein n=1 Tax=Streptomyces sp. NPDC048644 TaxID=3365582 RepID=UPI00372359D6
MWFDLGQMRCESGVAPVGPAECAAFRLSRFSDSTGPVDDRTHHREEDGQHMAQDGTLAAHRFDVQLDGVVVEAVKGISGLHADEKGGKVTITRGLKKSEVFATWIKKSLDEGDGAAETLTIQEENSHGQTIRRIQLFDAWVDKWESGKSSETVLVLFKRMEDG